MDSITEILARHKAIKINQNARPINTKWEIAEEFGKYVGLKTTFVLRLFKLYTPEKVLSLRSWLKDVNFDKRGVYGLITWKLKNDAEKNKANQKTKETIQRQTTKNSG